MLYATKQHFVLFPVLILKYGNFMISGKVEKGFFFRYTYYRRRERKCMQADTNVRVTETFKKKLQEK